MFRALKLEQHARLRGPGDRELGRVAPERLAAELTRNGPLRTRGA
jgi:hypothetical protein